MFAWNTDIDRGVHDFVVAHPDCGFTVMFESGDLVKEIRGWRGGGLIAPLRVPMEVREARRRNVPTVNISHRLDATGFPSVVHDDPAIGRMAAEHLLGLGFVHFGYVGLRSCAYSDDRWRGYRTALQGHARSCVRTSISERWRRRWDSAAFHARMDAWLSRLPRPAAVFACTDSVGWPVTEACHRLGIRIPNDVAVLACDNNELFCLTIDPPLSSVDTWPRRLGYEAAALMARLLAGKRAPAKPVRVPPRGIVQRHSTDVLAVDDEQLAAAMRFIREHAGEPINVAAVARAQAISRSSLERRCRARLGHTLLDELHRVRIERVKTALIRTNDTLAAISASCGFRHPTAMYSLFKRRCGMSPGDYRSRFREPA